MLSREEGAQAMVGVGALALGRRLGCDEVHIVAWWKEEIEAGGSVGE